MPAKAKSTAKKTTAKPVALDPFILIRTFDAPRDIVVKAWTTREHLMHWWGPKGITRLVGKLDLRKGGLFHYAMQMADGAVMWGKFTFREVALPERLVWLNAFSDEKGGTTRHPMVPDWPADLLTTIAFEEEQGGKTKVTVRWDLIDPTPAETKAFNDMRPMMGEGWGGSLDDLDAHLRTMVADATQKVVPHLTLGDAAKAIDWYKDIFGAKEVVRMPAKDGKRVLHCELDINGGRLLMSDSFSEHAGPEAPHKDSNVPAAVALELASPAKVDATYKHAMAAGARSIMEPADQFWGARFAVFVDPFGHRWLLNAANPKL